MKNNYITYRAVTTIEADKATVLVFCTGSWKKQSLTPAKLVLLDAEEFWVK